MSLDVAAITADVAGRLGVDDSVAEPSVLAAIDYIAGDTGVAADDMPADDIRLSGFGVPLLAMRMFSDAPNPSGAVTEFDPTFNGVRVPRRLYEHLDQYWDQIRVNWGIA
jgi:hypothetical protein